MNFMTQQDDQAKVGEPAGPDGGADAMNDTDSTYVADGGGDAKPAASKGMMIALGLAVACGVGYFLFFKGGPAAADAALPSGDPAEATITTFLANGEEHMALMRQLLQNTDKVVQRFRTYPARTQVPLADLRTNPFRQTAPAAKPEGESDIAARRRREEEQAAAQHDAEALRLQSVLHGGRQKACMINNTLLQPGQTVDGFTVEEVTAGAVVVRKGVYRFQLVMER